MFKMTPIFFQFKPNKILKELDGSFKIKIMRLL